MTEVGDRNALQEYVEAYAERAEAKLRVDAAERTMRNVEPAAKRYLQQHGAIHFNVSVPGRPNGVLARLKIGADNTGIEVI